MLLPSQRRMGLSLLHKNWIGSTQNQGDDQPVRACQYATEINATAATSTSSALSSFPKKHPDISAFIRCKGVQYARQGTSKLASCQRTIFARPKVARADRMGLIAISSTRNPLPVME